jgi:hypothetical protein
MQIWGINNVGLEQYVDMVFDMHDLEWTVAECYQNYWHLKDLVPDEELRQRATLRQHGFTKVLEYCARVNKPLMSLRKYKGVPSSTAYPLQQIIKKYDSDLFTSATPYAIAYAIFKDFDIIDLFGINCSHREEWVYQRDAITFWLGIAKGMGKKISVTGDQRRVLRSFDNKLYGYDTEQMPRGCEAEDTWKEPKEKYEIVDRKLDEDQMVLRKFRVWKES